MPLRLGPVLVVDDDAAVRRALKFALKVEGLDVRLYDGGDALLAEVPLPASGCLIIDYAMPLLNGIDLMVRLRARRVVLPAILITTVAGTVVRDRAARSGFRRVLEKPLDDDALLDEIRRALAEHPLPPPRLRDIP